MHATQVAEINEFLVLDAIRTSQGVTRPELARSLGLAPASISRIVQRLLVSGLIEEVRRTPNGRGRTPQLLHFVARAGAVIAIDLGGTRCRGALADLSGEVLADISLPTAPSAEGAVGTLLDCVGMLRTRAEAEAVPIESVAVGIPALIDPATGLAVAGPNVHWHGFDLLGSIDRAITEPFTVDNDVNLAALGQAWRGEGRGVHSFVTLSLGTGVGGAVVIDGHVVRGRNNAAGEVGHLVVAAGRGDHGAQADFEEVASGPGLRRRANELLQAKRASRLVPGRFDTPDIFAAAAAGDAVAQQVVEELLEHVAMAIVDVTAVLDPDRVILDGSVGRALAAWLIPLRAQVMRGVYVAPDVAVSSLGSDATIVGAIAAGLGLLAERRTPEPLRRPHGPRRLPPRLPPGSPPHDLPIGDAHVSSSRLVRAHDAAPAHAPSQGRDPGS
ncbi:MAG: ROK family transcriptional regulator [Acidimicrobiales bacterium]